MRAFCNCLGFKLWYEEEGTQVCECGHPRAEHLDGKGTCIGDVEITQGSQA